MERIGDTASKSMLRPSDMDKAVSEDMLCRHSYHDGLSTPRCVDGIEAG
jgi:hypothetical protein